MSKIAIPIKVDKRNRVVIPAPIRSALGIKIGDTLLAEYDVGDNKIVIKKIKKEYNLNT